MNPKYKRMIDRMQEKEGSIPRRRLREEWLLYILRCQDGSFYTGITKNLEARLKMHNKGKASRYTRTRRPVELLYEEPCGSRTQALVRECTVKALPKKQKERLVLSKPKGAAGRHFVLLLAAMVGLAGCFTARFASPVAGEIPVQMPIRDIQTTPQYGQLVRTYGKGLAYERTKILYLLDETRASPYQYYRNGVIYDSKKTAATLTRKWRQRMDKVRTAREFIDNVATFSSHSGKPYLAIPGDGKSYYTGVLLHHVLDRLEAFMDETHGGKKTI